MGFTLVDFVKQQEPLFVKAATDERKAPYASTSVTWV